jgi:plasmid stabilization system protein ParE
MYDRAQILLEHPEAGSVLHELRDGGWRKLIFRRWKIVYTIRGDAIIIGRVWPAAMGEADLETPL